MCWRSGFGWRGLGRAQVDEPGVEDPGAEGLAVEVLGAVAGAAAGAGVELSVFAAGALVCALLSEDGGSDPVSDSLLLAA